MFLGFQNNKIKFYTEQPLDLTIYNLDKVEETELEYVLDNEEYVLKDTIWEEKQRQKERERLDRLSLTKREVFLAIYRDKEITPQQIRSMLTSDEAQIEFDYANEYFRGNPLISQLGLALGYTDTDLDYLFQNKEFPKEVSND